MATLSGVKITVLAALVAISINSSSSAEYSGLLSSLYKKASEHNRPLILVLDSSKDLKQEVKHDHAKHVVKHKHESHEDETTKLVKLLQMLQQKQKKTSLLKESSVPHKLTHAKKSVGSLRDRKPRLRTRDQHEREEKPDVQPESPIVKSFLRMANSLRCAARDECKDECDNASTCEDTCDEEYKCEEEKKPCDNCGQTTCNICSDPPPTTEGCTGSTSGVEYITEKAKCPRC